MPRNNKKRKENYRVKIEQALAAKQVQLQPGTVSTLHVLHDNWCEIFQGGRCNCNPDIKQEFKRNPNI